MMQGRKRQDVQDVLGLNNKAPSSPDRTSASEGNVLGQREFVGWSVEI
jgi:hypothetical protein